MAVKAKSTKAKSTKAKSTKAKPATATSAKIKTDKPKGGKPSFLDRIASFVVPPNAAGLARVPASMAVSEQAAAVLGLGYPHVLVTLDEPLAELPDYATYKRRYLGAVAIPRALPPILHAIARSVPSIEALDKVVATPPAPPPLDEAISQALRFGGVNIVPVIEALYGSEPAATAFVAALVSASVADLNGGKYENYGYSVIYMLGHLLWRVPQDVRSRLRGELAGVLDRLQGAGKLWRGGKALDVILNGRAGVERSARGFEGKRFLTQHVWADDDPDWVASNVLATLATLRPADREVFDIQLAVVGGPQVLAALRGATDRFPKDQRASIEAQLALCAP